MDRAFSRLFDTDAVLVCYRLPSCFDFMSLYESDIREVHFMGELDDPEAVTFLNKLSKASPKDGFKVVQISVDGHNIS